eukprot:g11371.t1
MQGGAEEPSTAWRLRNAGGVVRKARIKCWSLAGWNVQNVAGYHWPMTKPGNTVRMGSFLANFGLGVKRAK